MTFPPTAFSRLARFFCRHRRRFAWSLVTLVALLIGHKALNTAVVEIEISSPHRSGFSIYWADEAQNYSESRVTHIRTYPHRKHYRLLIGGMRDIVRLRIDPTTRPETVTIRELSIYQFGFEPIRLRGTQLHRIKPFRRAEILDPGSSRLTVRSHGADPQLELTIDALRVEHAMPPGIDLWPALVIIVLCVGFAKSIRAMSRDYAFVPYAMLVAFTLVFVMSTLSRINAHPDEYVHIQAARYYIDHHQPPGACSEDTLHSYSPYGVSRLDSTEIAYFLTGKFAGALSFLPVGDAILLRYFNVFLLGILLLLSVRSVPFRMICLPVLASPQVWYVFSYVNSEGTALFAGLVVAHQLLNEESALRQLLAGNSGRRHRAWRWLGLGSLAALLLLIKKNFFVLDLFLASWVVVIFWFDTHHQYAQYARRLFPVTLVALLLYGAWIVSYEAANDFHRAENVEACRDRMVKPTYRPDASPESLHPTLYWRDRGYPFGRLFEQHWGTKVFYSAFGHFGYLEYLGPKTYYRIVAIVLLSFFAYVGYAAFRRGNTAQRLTAALGLGMFILLLALTMWVSWTKDFQPQGRYFFPMVPIVGLVLGYLRRLLDQRIVTAAFLLLFALSAYFFIFIGLFAIPKQ